MFIAGVDGGSSFLVLMHAGNEDIPFALPGAPYGTKYHRVIDTVMASAKSTNPATAGSEIKLVAHSMLVFEVVG
jgi:hypothetical protein